MSKISGEEILSVAGLKRKENFCLIGCPPCQSFSKLSETRGIRPSTDSRSKYVMDFARRVEEMRPQVVVFENVFWMFEGPGRMFFERYLRKMRRCGYETVYGVVNAADYGVPQNRRRLLAFSCKKKVNAIPSVPEKDSDAQNNKKKTFPKTVRDVIGDLPKLKAGESDPTDPFHVARKHGEKVMKIIRNIPKNGGSRRELPPKLWLPCHKALRVGGAESVYGRMWWDKPSPTITSRCLTPSCGRFLHPEQDRAITTREAARLQTIPDDYQLSGTREEIGAMIGDGVPVILAERIALKVTQLLRA